MGSSRIVLGLLLLLLVEIVIAVPPIASEYYGSVHIAGEPAGVGTNVSVYDSSGLLCGSFVVKRKGLYGFLSCKGDDPSTDEDEGAEPGEFVEFTVNNLEARSEPALWSPGSFNNISLEVGNAPLLAFPTQLGKGMLLELLVGMLIVSGAIVILIFRLQHHRK